MDVKLEIIKGASSDLRNSETDIVGTSMIAFGLSSSVVENAHLYIWHLRVRLKSFDGLIHPLIDNSSLLTLEGKCVLCQKAI